MKLRSIQVVGLALGSATWFGGVVSADSTPRDAGKVAQVSMVAERTTGGTSPVAADVAASPLEADQLAARAVDDVQAPARKPRVDSMQRAFARALARGWRYTGSARHVAVQVPRPQHGASDPRGSASDVPRPSGICRGGLSTRPAALQEYYADGRAEVTVWGWDDGDPATVEGTVFLYSHDTGEEFYFDVQHFAASDTDGWVTWGALIDYRGGWTYRDDDPNRTRWGQRIGAEFGSEVGMRPVALQLGGPNATISAYSRRRCLRQCLDRKMNNVFNATRTAALSSFIACTRSPATRFGLVVYASCVGGGSLGGFAIALTNEFVFATSCEEAC
jgi:hypothetical protein